MAEPNIFSNIFSALTPLRMPRPSDGERKKKAIFKITVSNSEPFLEVTEAALNLAEMSAGDIRIYNEIKRISESDDIFGISAQTYGKLRVSFWESPYLIHLIENRTSVEGPNGGTVTFADIPSTLILKITTTDTASTADIALRLRTDGNELEGVVFMDDTHVLCGDNVYEIKSVGANYTRIASLVTAVDKDLLESFLTLFLSYVVNILPELNGTLARKSSHTEHAVPTLYLEKVAADKALYLRTGITVESIGDTLPPGIEPTCAVRINSKQQMSIRDVEGCDIEGYTARLESMILGSAPDRMAKKEVYRDGNFFIIPEATAGPFLLNRLPQVLEEFRLVGSEKLKEYKVVAAMPKLHLNFSSGIDFLEGEGDVTIGEEHFTIADILNQYAKKRYVQLSDGNRGIIDESYINRLQRLFRRRDKDGRIKVNLFDLPEVEEMIQSKITGEFANRSRSVLEGFNGLKSAPNPDYEVKATLRPYQNEGVKWLKYLYDNKLGGCLADDMGLGKTLQTIALLSMIYPGCDSPTLIIMPRSLLFNWEKEFKRFCPAITFSTYYGTDRNLDEAMNANVMLTTYAVARNDVMKLKDHKFHVIVLDESQNIKNYTSQTTMAIQLLNSDHRFALSGTPMENNLTELYSLFRFLNPTMFGTIEDFNASYTAPIQKFGDKDASDSLRRKIFPFILRRLKKDVLDDLPPRIDQTLYVEMSEKQQRLYNERRLSYRQQIGEVIAKDGVQKSQFLMFQALNELRRIASVPESVSGNTVSSPKIEELVESLAASVSNGHKSVVFFNFIAGLEIVMSRLEKLGIEFETMTGSTSTSARKRIVERFQNDPDCMVMLLTLKVGGVGLNLTAADTVYMFEPWWNKAAEEQAINRLHRIGQRSTVSAFSLITVGTIEEKILQLQEQKSELFNELISADSASSKYLSEKDIDFILS
ncbi:MAG: DEAD/DEAH box helicase [Bacteroides sp.]|nr:DEAD/DEAH box helicase [Bacteroides sp.]